MILHYSYFQMKYAKIKRCTRISDTTSNPLLNDHILNKHHGISDDIIKL